MSESLLFMPLKVGNALLAHRIGMAPMTRTRATLDRAASPMMVEHYGQRAAGAPGTLIISEGTTVSVEASSGFPHAPGIRSDAMVAGWRAVTDEVHRHGGVIYAQLFAMGRAAVPELAALEGASIIGPSAIPIREGYAVPVAMTHEQIRKIIDDFVMAARLAVGPAGFDGVEVHGANGYLLDQFMQSTSNQRTDEYGGSIENRSRLILEVLESVVGEVGAERVGLRLSPWSPFQGMGMEDPVPQFSDVIRKAAKLGNLAFLHLVESRVSGSSDATDKAEATIKKETLDFAYDLWKGPLLIAGGYNAVKAQKLVEEHPDRDIVVVIGRYFIANPDLVFRIREGIPLAKYDRDTFYTNDAKGYLDYPYSEEWLATQKK